MRHLLVHLTGIMIAFLIAGCQPTAKVVQVNQAGAGRDLKKGVNQGFYYALPETSYEVQLYSTLTKTYSGRLAGFSNLLKYPADNRKSTMDQLTIDSIHVTPKTRPDYDKLFFVTIPPDKQLFTEHGYFFKMDQKGSLTAFNHEGSPVAEASSAFAMQQQPIRISLSNAQNQRKKPKQQSFDRKTLENGLLQLIRQNDELMYKLNRLGQDSLFRKDSVLRKKVGELGEKAEKYHGKIKELKALFETYRKADLGEKARQYSDVIHKLVELKTGLTGAQSDMTYQGADVEAMIEGIDEMLANYLKPFRNHTSKQQLKWQFTVTPGQDQQQFTFGLKKGKADNYYWEQQRKGDNYTATIGINFKKEQVADIGSFQRQKTKSAKESRPSGLYYNLPAHGTMTLTLRHQGKGGAQPVGETSVTLPQLGDVAALPTLNFNTGYSLDPFYGTLKRIHHPKPE